MPVVLLPAIPLTARTAAQLLKDALGLTNAVGVDQTLTANEITDGLGVINDVIEDWNTQSLTVYGLADQTFNTIAGTATYTVGAGAMWVTNRPVRIREPAYATVQGVSFRYTNVTQAQYDLIAFKTQPGGGTDSGQVFLYVNEYPLGLVTLWPVPNTIFPITFSMDLLINSVPTGATVLQFPPGYMKAFKYTIAIELAPLFGKNIEEYPLVIDIQKKTLGDIKRANRKPTVMGYDVALLGNRAFGYRYWP